MANKPVRPGDRMCVLGFNGVDLRRHRPGVDSSRRSVGSAADEHTFIDLFGTDRAGMAGLCVVLVARLAGMLAVRATGRSFVHARGDAA